MHLEYSIYDYSEHTFYHNKFWKEMLNEGGSIEDLTDMCKNVDALCDMLVFDFWEEITNFFLMRKLF